MKKGIFLASFILTIINIFLLKTADLNYIIFYLMFSLTIFYTKNNKRLVFKKYSTSFLTTLLLFIYSFIYSIKDFLPYYPIIQILDYTCIIVVFLIAYSIFINRYPRKYDK